MRGWRVSCAHGFTPSGLGLGCSRASRFPAEANSAPNGRISLRRPRPRDPEQPRRGPSITGSGDASAPARVYDQMNACSCLTRLTPDPRLHRLLAGQGDLTDCRRAGLPVRPRPALRHVSPIEWKNVISSGSTRQRAAFRNEEQTADARGRGTPDGAAQRDPGRGTGRGASRGLPDGAPPPRALVVHQVLPMNPAAAVWGPRSTS